MHPGYVGLHRLAQVVELQVVVHGLAHCEHVTPIAVPSDVVVAAGVQALDAHRSGAVTLASHAGMTIGVTPGLS